VAIPAAVIHRTSSGSKHQQTVSHFTANVLAGTKHLAFSTYHLADDDQTQGNYETQDKKVKQTHTNIEQWPRKPFCHKTDSSSSPA